MVRRVLQVGLFLVSAVAFGWVLNEVALATEPSDDHQIILSCVDGELIVFVGDHDIGMASYRLDGVDETWTHLDLVAGTETRVQVGTAAETITLWVTLDGVEVDPQARCFTTSTSSSSTSTSSTTSTSTSTTSTTSTTMPPTTTTSTPPSDCSDDSNRWECANTGVPGDLVPFVVWGGFFLILGGAFTVAARVEGGR